VADGRTAPVGPDDAGRMGDRLAIVPVLLVVGAVPNAGDATLAALRSTGEHPDAGARDARGRDLPDDVRMRYGVD
jgi:hypothetical protein